MDILQIVGFFSEKWATSDSMSAFLLVLGLLVILGFKFFNFWAGRMVEKDERQFQLIQKFIEDDTYADKVKKQPYLIKQVFFYRLHWLRTFSVDEIEFLIGKERFDYSIHELTDLKSADILKYSKQENDYIYISNWINNNWKDHFGRTTTAVILLFILSVLLFPMIEILTKSSASIVFCLIIMMIVEVLLIKKRDAMKIYIKHMELENS